MEVGEEATGGRDMMGCCKTEVLRAPGRPPDPEAPPERRLCCFTLGPSEPVALISLTDPKGKLAMSDAKRDRLFCRELDRGLPEDGLPATFAAPEAASLVSPQSPLALARRPPLRVTSGEPTESRKDDSDSERAMLR